MMANFLTRLAERTLGLTPVAQPIIASMFAPTPAIVQPTFQESAFAKSSDALPEADLVVPGERASREDKPFTHMDTVDTTPVQQIPPPPFQPTSRIASPFEQNTPDNWLPPRQMEQIASRTVPTPETDARAQPPEGNSSTKHGSQIAEAPVQSRPAPAKATTHSSPTISRPATAFDGEVKTPREVSITDRVPQRLSAAGTPIHLPSQEQDDNKNLPSTTATRATPTPPTIPPSQANAAIAAVNNTHPHNSTSFMAIRSIIAIDTPSEAQPSAIPAPEKPASAPTIRVTIGRIEVRAVMPPAEVPVQRQSARPLPALSLDDYLKQGKGGSR